MRFQKKVSFEKRVAESKRIRERYPTRVPCIVEKANVKGNAPELKKNKYLVPEDITMAAFTAVIRKNMGASLSAEQSIYLFVNDTVLVAQGQMMGLVDNDHKNKDGFLYITYALENTFG